MRYKPKEGTIRNIVYWYNKDRLIETKIDLPMITFEKIIDEIENKKEDYTKL